MTDTDCNLYGFDVSRVHLDTRERARPVRPSSTHAKAYISEHISVGQRSICKLKGAEFGLARMHKMMADQLTYALCLRSLDRDRWFGASSWIAGCDA